MHVARVIFASAKIFNGSCNLTGVCGPCVLRREKLVSYFIYSINFYTHTMYCGFFHFNVYLMTTILKLKKK